MKTFRVLLLESNWKLESNSNSSLDQWFGGVLDVPMNELSVGDIARSIRQGLFLEEVLPIAENILKKDPLAGEDYDGQLISSIASLAGEEIKNPLSLLQGISLYLNNLSLTSLDAQVVMDIEKIKKLCDFKK